MKSYKQMKELIQILEPASRAYYQEDREIMDNRTYDKLYDELVQLEKETGTVLAGSPTNQVGYEILSEIPKERHDEKILSLDKTKNIEELRDFLGPQLGLLSWKMDGLTVVLTYNKGNLEKAVTRGNGEIGEVITNNAKVFKNIPLKIPFFGKVILRGEAIIHYSDFKKFNGKIGELDGKYKNPRNLCSGSVRQLNTQVAARRSIYFFAFALMEAEGITFHNSHENEFKWLQSQGFDVVEYRVVTKDTLSESIQEFQKRIEENDIPSDGLVLLMDDIAYGESLGTTAKFPKNAMAFKWKDEIAETTLREIEWSPSRTGIINPIAVFDPVELEGTTVQRASVHNVSIVESFAFGKGDRIRVYKSNMIIPQIAENLTRSGTIEIPSTCPVCGGKTRIKNNNGIKFLYCMNPNCQAKKLKRFELFVSRDGMNIEGFSSASLSRFLEMGFIKDYVDIYQISKWKNKILSMEGWGEASYEQLITSIESSRNVPMERFLYAIGVPGIGITTAKQIVSHFQYNWERLESASLEELMRIDGIGFKLARGWVDYFSNSSHITSIHRLLDEIHFFNPTSTEDMKLNGLIFVITGSLSHFDNRDALKSVIEQNGGIVGSTVTSKTNYLISNDKNSTSSKTTKAKNLKIPILSEEEFLKLIFES